MSLYRAEILRDQPVMYLRVGESAGTSAADVMGLQTATYVNTPTLGVTGALTGDTNTAVLLNGTTQYITVADHATLDHGDTFTLECWVKRAAVTGGSNDSMFHKGINSYHTFFNTTDFLQFNKPGVAQIAQSTVALTDLANWHHVVVTKNGASVHIYFDAVDVTGTVTNQTSANTADSLWLGTSTGGASQFFNGSLDEIAVYPTALSAARVLAHYNAGIAKLNPATTDALTLAAATTGTLTLAPA